MSDDEITKVERALPSDTRTRLIEANDALVMLELRNMLTRQQEQDIVISELRGVVDTLAAGMVASIEEIQILKRNIDTLVRHQTTLHEKQDKIAKLCDHLVASIADSTEP